ncbi:hypothetical protein [Asticcacaulis taihuensis]|uniref:Uncharacterized protein n=1 Tax=Asticcacaulis taihuensis TaxID=260084 RepID=A0A1G4PUE6_9CAUL|nr:hypothetical protein [Asticcacaulis taihuensis]SCW35815.1 hypothetical protein SAMN02927928_0668 [Asticcacaulis taihuensis]
MNSIFWSWQSDLDPRVTRNLIREALAGAIAELDAELEERHELTSDTMGVAGSPDIVATILAKIDAAKVFVGDVTPIAFSAGGKALANPNVLIELGYAKRAIGLERVVLVWNTAFPGATIENLPFDMRGRRAPMAFHLPTGATTADLRTAREGLRNQLREALRLSIAVASPSSPPPLPEWQQSTSTPALWFDPGERLTINELGMAGSKPMAPGPYRYVRILPRRWAAPVNFGNDGTNPRILGPTSGYSYGTTKGGFLTYTGSLRAGESQLGNMVMQFRKTGELWGVDPFAFNGESGNRFFADAAISHFSRFINDNLPYLAEHGGQGPYRIKLGVSDLSGMLWSSETRWGGSPIALENQVEVEFEVASTDRDQVFDALLTAWAEVAAAFGLSAPPRQIMVSQIQV